MQPNVFEIIKLNKIKIFTFLVYIVNGLLQTYIMVLHITIKNNL